MRVLHYNILNGFNDCAISTQPLAAYLEKHPADILMLNEYRSHNDLDTLLTNLGYIHSAINTGHDSPNRAAIFSRCPIEKVVALPAAFRLVWVVINDINFIAYHASPLGVRQVKDEVRYIISMLIGVERIILCGDLNSLSHRDFESLEYGKLIGTAAVQRYSKNEIPNFDAVEAFEKAGFMDCHAAGEQHTVPTAHYREHELGATLRLDYVLSRNVAVANLEILREPCFHTLSDHFPIAFSTA